MRFVPLLGVLLMIGAAFCWRPWLQYRRHGAWGVCPELVDMDDVPKELKGLAIRPAA